MVKVWEQLYPGGDVTYIDESGATHVEGAQHRQTMPDAYPLPSTAPAGVTRKTPRGHKPPTQGRGSIKQGPWRECFKLCTIRWNALPDECPWQGVCPPTSSKKNVWDAKQAQGVMCAYYDLYQACCMSSCEQITITGPKGKPITRGIISAADNCFPCDNPSTGKVLSIAYWSQQMNVGEYQSLAAHDSVAGYSIPFCEDASLHWSIVSGGGSLTSPAGLSTEYHAPDTNENCDKNPTVKLTDCCGRTATLQLAVNANLDAGLLAYSALISCADIAPPDTCEKASHWIYAITANYEAYGCDGQLIIVEGLGPCTASGYLSGMSGACCVDTECPPEPEHPCSAILGMAETVCPSGDHRTPVMIEQGCCPEQVL